MFAPSSKNRLHLHSQQTDVRKSFDGPGGFAQNILDYNPSGGNEFVFIYKYCKNQAVALAGDLFYAVLQKDEDAILNSPVRFVSRNVLDYTKLDMIIDSLSIENIQNRKHYQLNI